MVDLIPFSRVQKSDEIKSSAWLLYMQHTDQY